MNEHLHPVFRDILNGFLQKDAAERAQEWTGMSDPYDSERDAFVSKEEE